MKFLRRFQRRPKQKPNAYSLVDVGRDTVKVAIVLMIPDQAEPQIIGYGQAETGGHDISGGRIEASVVTRPVNAALTQAEDSTESMIGQKIVPDDVIFALAGRATVGKLFTVQHTRPRPSASISPKELKSLRTRAERLVRQGLTDLPLEGGQWQALAVTDAGIRLDDHLVLDGVGLTGQEISLSVFGVAGQAGALRALKVLANRLDLMIANVVASSQALASLVPQAEAIILDIGLSGTEICLIRDNALTATGWAPFGGGFFTQVLAQALEIDSLAARELKHGLGAGSLSQLEAERVNTHLAGARQRWYEAVMEVLVGLCADKPLPKRIYLTGGGSLLPELDRLLRTDPAPFDRAPEVAWLGDRALPALKDLTHALDYKLFALTLSLSVGLPV